MKRFYPILFLLLVTFSVSAQKKVKWAKYSSEELGMEACSFDQSAKAIILYENSELSYKYERYVNNIHRRIKLFNKSELGRGIIKLSFDPTSEKIVAIEGVTTNQLRGKVISTKLRQDQIETRKISDNLSEMTIKLPEVRKGAIVEYRYERRSEDLDKPKDWFFQHDIPTIYSAYSQEMMPKDFEYFTFFQGPLTTEKYKNIGLSFWELNDIPSLPQNDPFLFNPQDYVEKIGFRNKTDNNDASSWATYMNQYLDSRLVKNIISSQSAQTKAELEKIGVGKVNSLISKANLIFRDIQKRYKWSGVREIYPEGKNNSADVNLRLYTLLKSINPNSFLVLLSSLEHGNIFKNYPLADPFDHVIVKTTIDGNTYFLDATNDNLPFGILPYYSESREGFTLEGNGGWLMTSGLPRGKNTFYQQISFVENALEKQYNIRWDASKSSAFRTEISKNQSEDYYKEIFGIPDSREIASYVVGNLLDVNKPLNTKFSYRINDYLSGQEQLYLNPIEYLALLVNPMDATTRYYPVQFKTLPSVQITSVIEIPTGYIAAKIPAPMNIALPEGTGKFSYQAIENHGKINLTLRYEISKNNIQGEFYQAVKSFYDTISEKCEEPIIFKKK